MDITTEWIDTTQFAAWAMGEANESKSQEILNDIATWFIKNQDKIARIAALEAALATSREQSSQLAALLERVTYVGQDGNHYMLNNTNNDELAKDIDTALAAWQQGNKGE
jgi:hypothetical protein